MPPIISPKQPSTTTTFPIISPQPPLTTTTPSTTLPSSHHKPPVTARNLLHNPLNQSCPPPPRRPRSPAASGRSSYPPRTPPPHPRPLPRPRRRDSPWPPVALRGLGCSASSAKVHSPSRRRKKRVAKEEKVEEGDRPPPRPTIERAAESEEFSGENSRPNWCFGERRGDGGSWRSSSLEPRTETPVLGSETGSPRHPRRSWRVYGSPGLLEELMMFDAELLLGEMDILDRFRDLRLDVDSMTYEELLELEDSIGYVSTGLREDEIIRCVRKTKHSIFNSLLRLSAETNSKCSICLDDYGVGDEVGKLVCGHGYHTCCIKQWLLRKNTCPVCKAAVGRS